MAPICAVIMIAAIATAPLTLADETPLVGPAHAEAPSGVEQFGQFVGSWTCIPYARQPDGSWQESAARPSWEWHYILAGHAIQDVWIPDAENSPAGAVMGTNLRVYDAGNDTWDMVWTTESSGGLQHFSATQVDANIVMLGDIPAAARPAHTARITFHNIADDHFDWTYEASAPGDDENWIEFSRLACDRKD